MPGSIEAVRARADRLASLDARVQFAIRLRENDGSWRPIAIVESQGIERRNGTARFTILTGEAGLRGRGYGGEAAGLLRDSKFNLAGMRP